MRILLASALLVAGSALAFGQATTQYKAPTQSLIVKVQNACGPFPTPVPRGCVLDACVCDQRGHNCHWTKICTDK
jgi:hypothetical protein